MKAVVKTEWNPEAVEVKDVDLPKIGPDEVLIKVEAAGLCGSDLEIYEATLPIPITLPRIIGHEFSGVVEQIGKGVDTSNLSVGDRVVSESGIVCRQCISCKMGKQNLCFDRKPLGFLLDGAFAEFTKVPDINVHRIPDGVSFEEAALTEPTSVGVHALIERGQVTAGETVLIVGAGTIGLLLLQLARAAGASTTIQIDIQESRLKIARDLGADITINPTKENLAEKIRNMVDNFPDVAFEATGNPNAVPSAIELTKKGGRIVLLGMHPKPLEKFDVTYLVSNEKTVFGSWAHASSTWDRAISLISRRKIDVGKIITHKLPLENVREGFDLFKKKEALKVLLTPTRAR